MDFGICSNRQKVATRESGLLKQVLTTNAKGAEKEVSEEKMQRLDTAKSSHIS